MHSIFFFELCCVVPKKIHFEVLRFEPKHPVEGDVCVIFQLNFVSTQPIPDLEKIHCFRF